MQTTPLFQYTGSLTTPPCAEGLTFLITQQPLPLNVVTFNSLKSVIKFNSRVTQNILGEANLLEVGAGSVGCSASGGGDNVISTTAVVETKTPEAPAATSSPVTHPTPVTSCSSVPYPASATKTKVAATSSRAVKHPKGTPMVTPEKEHVQPVFEEVDRSKPHSREFTT